MLVHFLREFEVHHFLYLPEANAQWLNTLVIQILLKLMEVTDAFKEIRWLAESK